MMKGKEITKSAKGAEIEPKWFLVDAEGQTLGRLATRIATILRGKNKVIFTPHVDTGDRVIVINARGIKVTGQKIEKKFYYRHSGYAGGFKSTALKVMLAKHPERVIKFAVEGMLPKGRLGRKIAGKLKVYRDAKHAQTAQKPEELKI